MNFEVPEHERSRWNATLKIMDDVTKGTSNAIPTVSIRADDSTQELELFVTNGLVGTPVEFLAIFDGLIYESGECMMSAIHFSKLATMGKGEVLEFRLNPASCFIKGNDRYVEIPKVRFSPIERAKIPTLIEVNKEDFRTAIRNVGSNLRRGGDQFETTLKLGSGDGGTVLEFFSADHHRMTMFSMVQIHQLAREIAIHQNSLKAILLFLDLEGKFEWGFDQKSMFFKSGHMLLVIPLIEAYEASVALLFQQQDSTEIHLKVNIKEAVEASKKCRAIFSIKKYSDASVIGELVNGKLILKSEAGDLVSMTALECEVIKGASGKFKLQPAYLENSLKNIEDVTALICFNNVETLDPRTQLGGVVVTGAMNDTTKHLIMQMRMKNE